MPGEVAQLAKATCSLEDDWTLPLSTLADTVGTRAELTLGGHILGADLLGGGKLRMLVNLWFYASASDKIPDDRFFLVTADAKSLDLASVEDVTPPAGKGEGFSYARPMLAGEGIFWLDSKLEFAFFDPIVDDRVLGRLALRLAGDTPMLDDSPAQIPQHSFPVYTKGRIAVPLGNSTTATEFGALAFDRDGLTLTWQDWFGAPDRPKGMLQRLLSKPAAPPRRIAQVQAGPEMLAYEAGCLTSEGLIIYSAGGGHKIKYGDSAAILMRLDRSGGADLLLAQDYLAIADSKRRGLRPSFLDQGRHVVLRSSYGSTNPVPNGALVIDTRSGEARQLALPRGYKTGMVTALEQNEALIIKPFTTGKDLSFGRFWINGLA